MNPGSLPMRPLTSRAQKALQLSDDAAAEMNHEAIGTEHLLLGLLADPIAPAAQILVSLGIDPDSVRAAVVRMHGPARQ